jgi:alpha-galactosidase
MAETRTHFGAWAIVSSPLTLSHDVNNDTISDKIWPIIANTEALAVNQAYDGFSGGPFKASAEQVFLTDAVINNRTDDDEVPVSVPASAQYYKPMGGGKIAVLLMNSDTATASLTLNLADVPGLTCKKCDVRDVWAMKDLGSFTGTVSASVDSHDAAFFTITASADDDM